MTAPSRERIYDCIVREWYEGKANGRKAILNADRRFIVSAPDIVSASREAERAAENTHTFGPKYLEFRCMRAALSVLPLEVPLP